MNKGKKSIIGLVIIIVCGLYFGRIFIGQQKQLDILYAKTAEIDLKIEKEKKLNMELEEEKKVVLTEEYIEKIAREKLGMIKDGEKIFVDINK